MALTEEQQQMVDQQIAVEDHRMANQTAETAKQRKLEALRMAKEVHVENRRTQSASEATAITANSIVTMATDLMTYVNNDS